MLRTSLKAMAARKLRLVTTSIAVLLGVAFMAGTFVLTDTISRSFDQLFSDIYDDIDTVVQGEEAFSTDFGTERPDVDLALLEQIEAVDGVDIAIPEVEGQAQIVGSDGDIVGASGGFGLSWTTDERVAAFEVEEGAPPSGRGEVVIDRYTATTGELEVGDTALVLTPAGNEEMTVVGIATYGDADTVAGMSVLLFDLETAAELMGTPGQATGIYLGAEEGVDAETLTARVAEVLPEGVEAVTGEQAAEDIQQELQTALSFITTFLLVFALIALFVGSFIIYNTFSILVAQRARENALLRAIGASRRQVLGGVLLESAVVGLAASVLGLLVGMALAAGLVALLGAVGLDLPGGGVAVAPRTVVVSFVAGLGVSVASAVIPARRAARIPPIAALREVAVDDSGRSLVRMILGGIAAGLGALLLVVGLVSDGSDGVAAVGLGALLVFVAVTVLGPVLALPVVNVLGWPLARLKGMTGALARQNALRNPKRTASTAAALMIGVTLVGAISIIAASTRASIDQAIEQSFDGDFVITAAGFDGMGGVSPTLAEELDGLPELDAVTGLRVGPAQIDGSTSFVVAARGDVVDRIFGMDVSEGSMADLGADGVAVSRDTAEEEGLALGDTVEARFATGEATLRVAAIYDDDSTIGGYVLDLAGYEANFPTSVDSQVVATVADGVDLAAADAAIERVAESYPQVTVQDRDEFREAQAAQVDFLLNMIYALLGLAVLIALIGIANTLALSILERTRELGLLRAVGMTRGQLRSMVRWEAVLISVLGAVLGLAVALLLGWSLVTALGDEGLTAFEVPVVRLGVIVVLAGLAGLLASLLPARRAARLDVLRAVTTE